MKKTYTIFGQGFIGTNLAKLLNKKKYKFFIPKKGKYKFKKDLQNIIYCIGSDDWVKDPGGAFDANLGIIPKIILNNKFKSFTLISSTRIYSNHSKKTNEDSFLRINPNLRNFYYNSLKIAAENFCLSLPNKKIKVLRMSNLFGDNFTRQIYLLPTLIRESVNKKKINIFINKKSSKDFLHVNEALDLMLKIIKKSKYRLYNIASGKNISLDKIANEIKRVSSCAINYKNQKNLIIQPKIDISRIKNEFNFKPKKNLIKSINHLINNYKNHA